MPSGGFGILRNTEWARRGGLSLTASSLTVFECLDHEIVAFIIR